MRDDSAILRGARFLHLENDARFWQQTMTDPYLQAAVTALGQVLARQEEEVPEVEVTTSSRSLTHVEAAERAPDRRRSAAKNVSDPIYQNAFISEARHHMGQPDAREAENLIGYMVTLSFNVDKAPVSGVLTEVTNHPSAPAYLILDQNQNIRYPLNSVQEIVKVR